MRVVVDSNIFFSALIKANGAIAELIFTLSSIHQLYLSDFTFEELAEHQQKLIKASKLSITQFEAAKHYLLQKFTIIHSHFIPTEMVREAIDFVQSVDVDDAIFVATNNYIKGFLWTGDKPLYNYLKPKNYQVLNTNDIRAII
jgi:predicted nucleic acid-binding protein